MALAKKILKWTMIVLLSITALVAVADAAWIYVPHLLAGRAVEDVDQYAQATSAISLAEDVKIVALGEATHGNVEFQTMKLSVLKTLVEKEGVRSFALEADAAEGMVLDRYIKGGEGRAEDMVRRFSFTIYRTQQMAELIEWMRQYNQGKPETEQLSFYGFDMQNPEKGVDLLIDYSRQKALSSHQSLVDGLQSLKEGGKLTDREFQQADKALEVLQAELKKGTRDIESQLMEYEARAMRQAIQYYQEDSQDYVAMNNLRDKFMADNVVWIQQFEASKGKPRILLAGHNGHIGYQAPFYKPMGSHLRAAYGSGYWAIGTDYSETVSNINQVGKDSGRVDAHFLSADPLAAQAKRFGGDYYLDFSTVEKGSPTADLISEPMSMGSLGEGYSFLMHLLPTTHRIEVIPQELYDAMIFVHKAGPIEPMEAAE